MEKLVKKIKEQISDCTKKEGKEKEE